MSNSKGNGFLKNIFSLLKSKEQKIDQVKFHEKTNIKNKIWKKDYNPLRKVILWGRDRDNNPGFLILYGKHEFKEEGINNVLADNVTYTSYAVFKGKEGHLPSFQSVAIIEENPYYRSRNNKNDNLPKMYYKTGIKSYWTRDENYRFKEFKNLSSEEQIVLPYFTSNFYEEYAKTIEEKNISFFDFKLAKSPNEILKLDDASLNYYEIIYDMISNENIYMRKKRLNELIQMNPPRNIYELLLNIGSTELISGLFLEFAKRSNPILIEEAKNILESEINWAEESYIKGVKRCAKIYITALYEELKFERINDIYKSLPQMDLHLISINGNDIPEDKVLEGSLYRKYAAQGLLREIYGSYDYEDGECKWVERRPPQRYKKSIYSDGVVLKSLELKNTLQEAETYGLADVIGKIAYYLDAPRLNYYFKGNEKTKELKYYKRYIRRIINSYGENDSEKFIQAMKALLTSYTEHDYVCKFRGNFQFNEFLKNYLYYDFKEKPPVGWENWQARSQWMRNDQLMKLKGRYEFMKEIWDNHLEDVLEIASLAKISPVLKACYYILKDSKNTSELVEKMSYKDLIHLAEGSYELLSNMFKDVLCNKLKAVTVFEPEIMFALMNSSKEDIHKLAKEFINRTNGSFLADDIVKLMLLNNVDIWTDLFKESLLSLNNNEYCNFVKAVINSSDKFSKANTTISKEIRDILSFSISKIQDVSEDEKANLISYMISESLNANKIPDWIQEFIEEVIFSISYEALDTLVKKIIIKPIDKAISQRCRQVICVLETIRNKRLPLDTEIISILENGTSKMINILFETIMKNSEELSTRVSTLLIMFESDVTILNKKAEEIFDSMIEDKQRKLHRIIIDSPVKKVYSFGLRKLDEVYKDLIPKDFILQMLEHNASEVKAYISNKTSEILNSLGHGDKELFMYYIRTLLFLPNKVSQSKDNLYEVIPKFVLKYRDKLGEVEEILLDIGGSNIIKDSERALITLAKIRKEVVLIEG